MGPLGAVVPQEGDVLQLEFDDTDELDESDQSRGTPRLVLASAVADPLDVAPIQDPLDHATEDQA
jgi:hypothetical protein